MALLAPADVDRIRNYLTGARTDVLHRLPDFEWSPAWKSEAAAERANTETRRDGSLWGEQPLIWPMPRPGSSRRWSREAIQLSMVASYAILTAGAAACRSRSTST